MAAQFGPHRWSAGGHPDTGRFRAATVEVADLTGATFRDCDLTGTRIIDSWLVGVDVSGYVERFTVNGVDVTDFVAAELDRRHPERVQLREMGDADDFRAMAATISGFWSAAVARVERLPGPAAAGEQQLGDAGGGEHADVPGAAVGDVGQRLEAEAGQA